MSKNVLFLKQNNSEYGEVIRQFQNHGYHVVEYNIKVDTNYIMEAMLQEIAQILYKNLYYFVFSFKFYEEMYQICMRTSTKYVTCSGEVRKGLNNSFCLLQNEINPKRIEECVFNKPELDIYNTIDKLYTMNNEHVEPIIRLEELSQIKDDGEVVRLTDCYFDKMEKEKTLTFLLKEQLMEYIDGLLKLKTKDSWQEILLWNKRYECRKLGNRFWQFYLLQKVSAIYAEEMIQFYECGEEPSVVQLGSFEELSETYFHLLLLLRRLNYEVASEEEADIVDYIMEKKMSGIFIRHVIEHNQIEDKEKVYKRLEELLIKYEQ